MARTFLLGVVAAVLGVGVWLLVSVLNLGVENGLLGVGAGLVLGLVQEGSPLARYAAFLIGLVLGLIALGAGLVGWVGFVIVILLLTVISGLTGGRLPMWAMVLGAGVFAAMYTEQLLSTGWFFLTQYPTAFFVALATSSGGFVIAVFVELLRDKEEAADEAKEEANEAEASGIDTVIGGAK
ncbi:MAG: hypothetical protein U0904_09065 [Candidatus Nanopelagicales bacterium]|nr:hypothetical protein [Candidatus Nanopelagicales bacterium]